MTLPNHYVAKTGDKNARQKNLWHRFFSGITRGSSDGGIHQHHYAVMDDGNKPWRTLWLPGKLFVVFHIQFLLKPSHQVGLYVSAAGGRKDVFLCFFSSYVQACFHRKTRLVNWSEKEMNRNPHSAGQRLKPVKQSSSAEPVLTLC